MGNLEDEVIIPNKERPYLKPLDQTLPGTTIRAVEQIKEPPSKTLKDYTSSLKKMTKD